MYCLAVHSIGCLTIVAVVCYTDTDVYVYLMLYILTLLLSLVDVLYVMLTPPVQPDSNLHTYEKIEGVSGQFCGYCSANTASCIKAVIIGNAYTNKAAYNRLCFPGGMYIPVIVS
jgi:hypothetical protein